MLPVKNRHSGYQQAEKQRHEHRRNKPIPEIKPLTIGHVTAFFVQAGARTLSVTDNSPGRAR